MFNVFENKAPVIAKNAFIAETACIIGDASIGEGSSVWFNAVIRADNGKISIGRSCSIQDNVVIHTDDNDVKIGDGVTIGHGCIMHGSIIENNVLIGMNATILHGAEIGEYTIIGAGALVTPGQEIPARSVVLGVPAKRVRMATDEDIEMIIESAKNYERLAERYLKSRR